MSACRRHVKLVFDRRRYGETSRLVAALFRLARKIAPTIIFIDEVPTAHHVVNNNVVCIDSKLTLVKTPECWQMVLSTVAVCSETCRHKLQVDALLGRRKDGDHEATTTMKTEFMQFWDGYASCCYGPSLFACCRHAHGVAA